MTLSEEKRKLEERGGKKTSCPGKKLSLRGGNSISEDPAGKPVAS